MQLPTMDGHEVARRLKVDPALRAILVRTHPTVEQFDREHLRMLTDKLSGQAVELQRTNERLTAMIDLGLQFGSERDPQRLLLNFCHAARDIIGARYATAGIANGDSWPPRHFCTRGMDIETVDRLGVLDLQHEVFRAVLKECRCVQRHNPGGDPVAVGFPASYPPIDDLDAVRTLARHVLQGCGYTALEARDGAGPTRSRFRTRGC